MPFNRRLTARGRRAAGRSSDPDGEERYRGVHGISCFYSSNVVVRGVELRNTGGEPLFFWEWAAELLKRFKAAGLHTCLDTSLYAPSAAIDAVLPYVDMWLPDYKAHDDALHQKFTGVSNRIIRENLERLVKAKTKLEVRCLAVPHCTDGDDLAARHEGHPAGEMS